MASNPQSTRPIVPRCSSSSNYLQALASAQSPSLTAGPPRPTPPSTASPPSPKRASTAPDSGLEQAQSGGMPQTPTASTSNSTSTSTSISATTAAPPSLGSLPPRHELLSPTTSTSTGTAAPPPTPIAGTGMPRPLPPLGDKGAARVVQSGPGKEDVGEGKSWDEQDMKRVVQRRLLSVEKARESGFSSVGGEGGRNP